MPKKQKSFPEEVSDIARRKPKSKQKWHDSLAKYTREIARGNVIDVGDYQRTTRDGKKINVKHHPRRKRIE